jgi:hypothetical protein
MKHNFFIYVFSYFPCLCGLNMVVQLYLFFVFLCENMTNLEESDKLQDRRFTKPGSLDATELLLLACLCHKFVPQPICFTSSGQ